VYVSNEYSIMKYSVNNRTNTGQEGVILCAKVNNLCGGYLMPLQYKCINE
jgi:hypothetical protein